MSALPDCEYLRDLKRNVLSQRLLKMFGSTFFVYFCRKKSLTQAACCTIIYKSDKECFLCAKKHFIYMQSVGTRPQGRVFDDSPQVRENDTRIMQTHYSKITGRKQMCPDIHICGSRKFIQGGKINE